MMRPAARCPLLLAFLFLALPATAAELALKRVVLSSAGIGYFEHEATVAGDPELELRVRLDQVDDVLKSLVVLDGSGGIAAVTLPGREAPDQLFRDLPFDENALANPATLLQALRGAEIRLKGGNDVAGRVLSATREETALPNGGAKLVRTRLAILTPGGIEQAILEEASRVEFADPKLTEQLGGALQGLLARRAADQRVLRLRLTGSTSRTVRVGYTVEAPLWKAAYRLILPQDPAKETAALQGWAVVENLGATDWRDIELTLVSGNPVTFHQALYTAYHVKRPEVPVEVMGRVLPPIDTGTLPQVAQDRVQQNRDLMLRRALTSAPGVAAAAAPIGAAQAEAMAKPAPEPATPLAAAVQEATTQVAFTVPGPVTAASGTSLVLPIVAAEIPAQRVALFQPATDAAHPLASVRLANRSGAAWPPGVLSLYETGPAGLLYAGDARFPPLPGGEERLLSYAVDQKVEIARENRSVEVRTSGTVANGIVTLVTTDRAITTYRIRGAAGETRRLLIEHARDVNGRLIAPDGVAVEDTRTQYRLGRELAAGENAVVEVAIERPRWATVELLQLDQKTLAAYAKRTELTDALKAAFRRLAELRAAVDAAETERTQLDGERQTITGDQRRVRDNLGAVSTGTDLHKRYLETLRRQEDRLDKIDGELRAAQLRVDKAKQALTDAVQTLQL